MADRFAARGTGIAHVAGERRPRRTPRQLPEADVVVVSMMWKNDLVPQAKRLKFVQSISAGIDQYDQDVLRAHGIRLANAAGVNAHAVAEHAMALILALKRHLHTGRDNQAAKHWRGMISEIAAARGPARRQDPADRRAWGASARGWPGSPRPSTCASSASGAIPAAAARVRTPSTATIGCIELLAQADIVALTCPLTPETTNLIDAKALAAMRPDGASHQRRARKVVDEPALIKALQEKRIAAAGLDVTQVEPLPAASPLWAMPNVLITPHTAGETQRYEDGVIDLLVENLDRLWRGETTLKNQIV